jgi:hypothetical protein
MMFCESVLTAYTVPSTFVRMSTRILSATTAEPYRRVVGLSLQDEETQWSQIDPRNPDAIYAASDAEVERLIMPDEVAQKIGAFFTRFFVDEPRIKLGRHLEDQQVEDYNCHRFGYWMRGVSAAQRFELPEAPDHVVEMGRRALEPLPAGQHGVIGVRDDQLGYGSALHSAVGLGQETEDCIQVLASDGFMGIDTYTSAIDFYQSRIKRPDNTVKLYY